MINFIPNLFILLMNFYHFTSIDIINIKFNIYKQ